MLGLFRRPSARPGRTRGRVVLRLEGFERRDQPSDLTGNETPVSTTGEYGGQTNQPPRIEVHCQEMGIGLFRITGRVTDESPGGLTVTFDGIPSIEGKTITTNSDGTFSFMLHVKTDGTDVGDVIAQTKDAQGLDSNIAWESIHPTPPPG